MEEKVVLIVDDESLVRNSLQRLLRWESYRIILAASAQEALELLRINKVDLIIADYLMPKMSGLELLKIVRILYPSVLRIILTEKSHLAAVVNAMNEGEIYRFLIKPWNDEDLKNTINRISYKRSNFIALRH